MWRSVPQFLRSIRRINGYAFGEIAQNRKRSAKHLGGSMPSSAPAKKATANRFAR
jgi:hypothetical protein